MTRLSALGSVKDSGAWAQAVFGEADLGDVRRTARLVGVASLLAHHTGQSMAAACGGDKAVQEGAYRLARNNAVRSEDMAEAGFMATVKDAEEFDTLLAVEDTTVLSYSHSVTAELGDVGGKEDSSKRGVWAHSVLLVDAAGEGTVGLVDQQCWVRNPDERGKRHGRKERPYEDKESFKWQRAAEAMRSRMGPLVPRVVSVCDREADVYLYLADKLQHAERFVVRAAWDRAVVNDAEEQKRLWGALAAAPVCGKVSVEVPQRGGRPRRTAKLTLRTARVRLTHPKTPTLGTYPAHITVNALQAREENPPKGTEALDWTLLTSEPLITDADIQRVLRWYRLRWRIEVFHKVWKTGAGVERQRMQHADNLLRMAVILAFVSIRLLQLRELFEHHKDVSIERILTPIEWKILWVSVEMTKPPKKTPKAQWAYHALGRLAGWTDTKRTGIVGWDTLWKGWVELQTRVETHKLVQQVGIKL